jgi:hypothetical protein
MDVGVHRLEYDHFFNNSALVPQAPFLSWVQSKPTPFELLGRKKTASVSRSRWLKND